MGLYQYIDGAANSVHTCPGMCLHVLAQREYQRTVHRHAQVYVETYASGTSTVQSTPRSTSLQGTQYGQRTAAGAGACAEHARGRAGAPP